MECYSKTYVADYRIFLKMHLRIDDRVLISFCLNSNGITYMRKEKERKKAHFELRCICVGSRREPFCCMKGNRFLTPSNPGYDSVSSKKLPAVMGTNDWPIEPSAVYCEQSQFFREM